MSAMPNSLESNNKRLVLNWLVADAFFGTIEGIVGAGASSFMPLQLVQALVFKLHPFLLVHC